LYLGINTLEKYNAATITTPSETRMMLDIKTGFFHRSGGGGDDDMSGFTLTD
jgi:hypothetical protein